MLKNLKVGTKLVAILVAPVLVLVLLAFVGVPPAPGRGVGGPAGRGAHRLHRGRRSLLIKELQLEGLYSAVYSSTNKTGARTSSTTQRQATDGALAAYRESLETVQPGRDEETVEEAVKQADNRLERLDISRKSVDSIQSDAMSLVEGYENTTRTLLDVNIAVMNSVDDPELARGLQVVNNLSTVQPGRGRRRLHAHHLGRDRLLRRGPAHRRRHRGAPAATAAPPSRPTAARAARRTRSRSSPTTRPDQIETVFQATASPRAEADQAGQRGRRHLRRARAHRLRERRRRQRHARDAGQPRRVPPTGPTENIDPDAWTWRRPIS